MIVPRFCQQRVFLLLCHKKQRLMKKSWKLRRTSFFPIWTFCCRGCRCPGLGLASADLERARKLIQWVKKERMERRCNCFKKEWVFGVFASMRVWMCVGVRVRGWACVSFLCVCVCVCVSVCVCVRERGGECENQSMCATKRVRVCESGFECACQQGWERALWVFWCVSQNAR